MPHERMSPMRRRFLCLIGSILALLGAVCVFGYTGFGFFTRVFASLTQPMVEFDEGEVRLITPDDDYSVYTLFMLVESIDDPVQAVDVKAEGSAGATITLTDTQGWKSQFGRHLRRVRDIEVTPAGASFEIVADVTDPAAVEGRGDFALFRDVNMVATRYMDWAMPWWIAGGLLTVVSLVLLGLAVFWRGQSAFAPY